MQTSTSSYTEPNTAPTRRAEQVLQLDTALAISSFAENAAGDLYVLDYGGGRRYAIVPA